MQHMTIVSFKFKQEVKQSLTTELHSHDHLWHGGAIQPEMHGFGKSPPSPTSSLFSHKIGHLPNFGSELKEQFAFIQFSSFLSIVCFQLLSSLYHLVPPVLDGVAAVVTSIHQSVCHF